MIENPEIGAEYIYAAKGGFGDAQIRVRVIGIKGNWIETRGVVDGKRRDVPRSRLEH